jgi:chitin synthase
MLPDKNEDGTAISFFQSVIIRSQYVEYKISHYLDKAAESLFGFVSVLPGAFSGFRWEAIKGEPLRKFLKGQALTDSKKGVDEFPSCFKANLYLAEDRIMCHEIITKTGFNYLLRFVPGCKALTDAPSSLTQLIKQRRRWFNGSFFATIHVIFHMCKIWRRKGSFIRNLFFYILFLYMILNTFVGFFLVGLYYGAFSVFVRSVFENDDDINPLKAANLIENMYLIFIFTTLVF